jgi:hypothetical protein
MANGHRAQRLSVRQPRACDPRTLKFKTTADLQPIEGTVGQDRAVRAMDFGLGIEARVNVRRRRPHGRSTALRRDQRSPPRPPQRLCYVFASAGRRVRAPILPDRDRQPSHVTNFRRASGGLPVP